MFYENREHRHAAARRGAPRRAGGIILPIHQKVHGTVLDVNRGRRRGPPWGAAASRVKFWYFVYFMICIGAIWVLDV